MIDRPGGIFVRPAEQISDEDRVLVQSVARAIISDRRGALAEQINRRRFVEQRTALAKQTDRRSFVEKRVPRLVPTKNHRSDLPASGELPRSDLLFFNGLGGFTPDGSRLYVQDLSVTELYALDVEFP